MADEDLTIGLGADTSGLDDAERRSVAFVDRFAQTIAQANRALPPIDLDTSKVQGSLAAAGTAFQRFLSEARDLQAVPFLDTAAARGEIEELIREFPGLNAAIKGIDPTGILQRTATQAREAAQALLATRATAATPAAPLAVGARGDETQQLRLLAALTEQEEAHERQLNAASRAAVGLAAAETQLAFTMAQQSRAGADATAAVRLQAEAAARAQDQLNQAQRLAAASQPVVRLPPVAGSTLLASQDDTRLAQSAERNAAATARLNVELERAQGRFIQVARGTREVASGADTMAAGIAAASTTTERGTAAFGLHAAGASRAANAISALAATSLGAEGPVARLAQSALFLGGGTLAVAAGATGVLAVGAAYRFVTTAEREAREEQDRYVQGLLQEATTGVPAAVRASAALTAALEAQRKAREGITLADVARVAGTVASLTTPTTTFGAEFARRNAEAQAQATKAARQAQLDFTASVRDFQSLNVRTLTESISLHQANGFQLRQAQGFVRLLEQQEREANRPLTERIALHQQLLALQAALRDDAQANAIRATASQNVQAELAAQQQGIQGQQAALQAALAQELITRQQFFERRRALTVQAARADITALARQLEASQSRSSDDPAQQRLIENQSRALAAQILLRKDLLRIQEQQIDADKRLADQEVLLRAGIGFLTPSGQDIGGQGPALVPDVTLKLKPRLDLTEVNAAIAQFEVDLPRFQFENAFERARLTGIALSAVLGEINLKLRDIGNANINTPQVTTLTEDIRGVTRGLDDIARSAHTIGLIGDEAANAIGDVLNLADALGNVAAQASAGNILGLIGAGIGLIGAVSAPRESEIQRNAVLEENNRRLQELADALRDVRGVGTLARERETLTTITALRGFFGTQASGAPVDVPGRGRNAADLERQTFQKELAAAGIDLREFAAEVKAATGIDILDKKGRLVAGAFDQAKAAIDKMVTAATTFADSFDEQQRRLDLGSRLRGEPQDEASRFQREVEAASKLSPAVAEAFKGVDLRDQEAARKAALGLFEKFDAGFFTAHPELFGGLGKDDFLRFLEDSATFLDSFNKGLADATQTLQNVPDISTFAELEFAARSPINRPGDGASLPPLRGTDINPPVPGVDFSLAVEPITDSLARLSGGATLQKIADLLTPQTTSGTGQRQVSQFFAAPITIIVQGAVDDPAETARRVRAEFLRTTLATSGREEDAG